MLPVNAEAATVAAEPIQISDLGLPSRPLKLRLALEIDDVAVTGDEMPGDADAGAAAGGFDRRARPGQRSIRPSRAPRDRPGATPVSRSCARLSRCAGL